MTENNDVIFYNTKEIFNKLFLIGKLKFVLCGNNTRPELWWFDVEINKRVYQFSKGIRKFDPVHLTIQYKSVPPYKHGTGARILDNIQTDIFNNVSKMDNFLAKIKTYPHYIPHNEVKDYSSINEYYKEKSVLKYFLIDSNKDNKVTYQMWKESGLFFTKFMEDKIGCEVDDDIYFHFLEVVPPRRHTSFAMMCGEEYNIDSDGKSTYTSFVNLFDRWFYVGNRTVDDINLFKKIKLDCEDLKT